MPGMDGHEVLARLRADPTTHHTPVIFGNSPWTVPKMREYGLKPWRR